MGPASVAAINKVDAGRLMAKLVSLSMQHDPRAAKADNGQAEHRRESSWPGRRR
jgi:hypothetical protein